MSDSLLAGWSAIAPDASFSAPSACAQRAALFERKIKRRNRIEYAAGALAIGLLAIFGIGAIAIGEYAIAAASGAIVAGVAVVLWQLARRGGSLDKRPEEPCLEHLRRQYRQQYAALQSVPLWYIGPLVPGIALFYFAIGAGVAREIGWTAALQGLAGPAAATFGIFAAIALVNRLAARGLKRKLEELERLG